MNCRIALKCRFYLFQAGNIFSLIFFYSFAHGAKVPLRIFTLPVILIMMGRNYHKFKAGNVP